MTIKYVIGDATRPEGTGEKIIVHVCNDIGAWGAGFVMALSKKWPEPESRYLRWSQAVSGFELGAVQFVHVESELLVANLIGQCGVGLNRGRPPIRYDAIRKGLARVARMAQDLGASVHMPRIGCGLAGGKWEEIEPIIQEELVSRGISVTVYDLVQA